MSRKIEKINFEDIDFSDCQEEIEELKRLTEELLNDKEIKKSLRKYKYIKRPFHKIVDFIDLIIDYGFWNVITGRCKIEYFNLEDKDDEDIDIEYELEKTRK